MKTLEIVIATNNKHKIEEYENLFKGIDVKLYSLKDLNLISNPNETGKTFEENALIKANSIKNQTDKIILSDDSGVSIDVLGNEFPGIYSHRYQEELGGDKKANEILVKKCNGSRAHYTCAICIKNLCKSPLFFVAKVYGTITNEVKGNNGFGYDPIFVPDNYTKTFGELDESTKNKISHRANAIQLFINYLKENNII